MGRHPEGGLPRTEGQKKGYRETGLQSGRGEEEKGSGEKVRGNVN